MIDKNELQSAWIKMKVENKTNGKQLKEIEIKQILKSKYGFTYSTMRNYQKGSSNTSEITLLLFSKFIEDLK